MALRFDLQSHSTHSDGALEPAEVVRLAAEAGVELLALSDHDTVTGVSKAMAAGERHGVRIVPAVEISAVDDGAAGAGAARELHILGYRIDHTDELLTERLTEFLSDRERRTMRMAGALEELGLELDQRTIAARRAAGQPIGRPHLAEAVLACPANAQRLKDEGIDDIGSLIRGYLSRAAPPSACARRPRWPRPSRRSTTRAAWPSGRTPSGICQTPPRRSPRSTASARSESTGWRPST